MSSLFIQIFLLFSMFLLLTIATKKISIFVRFVSRELFYTRAGTSPAPAFSQDIYEIFSFLPGYISGGIFSNQVGSRECGWQDLPVWLHPFRSPANWTFSFPQAGLLKLLKMEIIKKITIFFFNCFFVFCLLS